MQKYHIAFLAILVVFSLMLLSNLVVSRVFLYPFTPLRISPVSAYATLDMGGVIAGVRRIAADIAWIQLLQYYGSPEKPVDKETEFRTSWDMAKFLVGLPAPKEECHAEGCHEEGHHHADFEGGVYPEFLAYSSRVACLDPFFSYANLYGAGALAWNMNRPEEAAELLREAVVAMEKYRPSSTKDIHQPFWQYHLYLSAIIYRNSGETGKMVSLLETAVKQPQCPNMVKTILAHIYQKDRNFPGALKLWFEVYDSNDPSYQERAKNKILELKNILGL